MQKVLLTTMLLIGVLSGVGAAQTADDLFAPNTIRDLHITMSDRDWATLRQNYLLNTYYACDVRVVLGGQDAVIRNVGLRSRGSGSRSGVKPALKIDISRYVSGQRFLGLRSIILRNALQDQSMIREHVTFELERRMGLAVPRTVSLLGSSSTGCTADSDEIAEDVDEEFLDRVAGEHAGYLFEYSWTAPYFFQYLGSGFAPYASLWDPKTRSSEPASVLFAPFEALTRSIQDSRPDDFSAAVGRFVDIRQALRLAAADNFLAEWDGLLGYAGLNNIYFYRPVDGPGLIIPWDKDNTFHDIAYPVFEGTQQNALTARALQDPRWRAVYIEALREAAAISMERVTSGGPTPGGSVSPEPLGWMESVIESTARLIRKSAWADTLKPYSNAQFEAAVAEARRFARLRAAVVDDQLTPRMRALDNER